MEVTGFAERLLSVIDDGRRVSTYKLAVLLALMDCSAEGASATGAAPDRIPTRTIAYNVAARYWPQLRPFPGGARLRQITSERSSILAQLGTLAAADPDVKSWEAAAAHHGPTATEEVLDEVELTVARYPLVRLQTVDCVSTPFIYDLTWGEGVYLAFLRRGAAIEMRPGAGDHLIRLAPLVRPLVELHWIRMVAGLNGLDTTEDALRRHLFGTDRTAFPPSLRRGLVELQEGRCFYCRRPVLGASALDHFIPWSRWPNDAVENLVMSHDRCNSQKSDRVAGVEPLVRWTDRLRRRADDLAAIAERAGWRSDRERTAALARSIYAHLPPDAPLWEGHERLSVALGVADVVAQLADI